MQAEIDNMLKTGGTIVNLASIAGLIGFPGSSPYVATKHSVIDLTRNAALEYARSGIRLNAVCSGGIDMRMLESLADQSTQGTQTSARILTAMSLGDVFGGMTF